MIVDYTPMPLAGVGSIVTPQLSLPNVYLIPNLKLNFAFVGQICDSSDYLFSHVFWFVLLYTGSAISKADWDKP